MNIPSRTGQIIEMWKVAPKKCDEHVGRPPAAVYLLS